MGSMGSVSRMIGDLRDGSEAAAEALWSHYWSRLRAVSKRELGGLRSRMVDDEDIAITAFHSFVRRVRMGEYPDVANRDEAWRLLVVIAVRKALNCIRDENRLRRNPRNHPAASGGPAVDSDAIDAALQPDVAVMIADSVDHLLEVLGDDELREIAIAKLAGYTNQEIAAALRRSVATIERRLNLIRVRWQQDI